MNKLFTAVNIVNTGLNQINQANVVFFCYFCGLKKRI